MSMADPVDEGPGCGIGGSLDGVDSVERRASCWSTAIVAGSTALVRQASAYETQLIHRVTYGQANPDLSPPKVAMVLRSSALATYSPHGSLRSTVKSAMTSHLWMFGHSTTGYQDAHILYFRNTMFQSLIVAATVSVAFLNQKKNK